MEEGRRKGGVCWTWAWCVAIRGGRTCSQPCTLKYYSIWVPHHIIQLIIKGIHPIFIGQRKHLPLFNSPWRIGTQNHKFPQTHWLDSQKSESGMKHTARKQAFILIGILNVPDTGHNSSRISHNAYELDT